MYSASLLSEPYLLRKKLKGCLIKKSTTNKNSTQKSSNTQKRELIITKTKDILKLILKALEFKSTFQFLRKYYFES